MGTENSGRLVDRGRRDLWRQLLGGVLAMRDELSGVPQMSVDAMGDLPDAVLAEMVPTWREGLSLRVRDDGLYRLTGDDQETCVSPLTAAERLMVDQYAGGRNLRTIARHVAAVTGVPEKDMFEDTRALFVRLCQGGWCHPAAAHDCRGETGVGER